MILYWNTPSTLKGGRDLHHGRNYVYSGMCNVLSTSIMYRYENAARTPHAMGLNDYLGRKFPQVTCYVLKDAAAPMLSCQLCHSSRGSDGPEEKKPHGLRFSHQDERSYQPTAYLVSQNNDFPSQMMRMPAAKIDSRSGTQAPYCHMIPTSPNHRKK